MGNKYQTPITTAMIVVVAATLVAFSFVAAPSLLAPKPVFQPVYAQEDNGSEGDNNIVTATDTISDTIAIPPNGEECPEGWVPRPPELNPALGDCVPGTEAQS